MKINPVIQEIIAAKVLAANEEREPSGNLAPSRLGWPLQWQMLHYLKIPQKVIEEYTLRKFQRGRDVEERIMAWLAPTKEAMQVTCTYRGITGYADVILDYPIEVKSTTNMAFKYRQKEGVSRGHRLQAEFYAKAKGYDRFGVAYVASDDYRVLCFEELVTDETDKVIDRYLAQKKLGVVPEFEAEEKWHALADYNPYPDWQKLDAKGIADKLSSMGVVMPVELPLEVNK